MTIVKPRIPSGFSEYAPEDQIEFNRLLDIIKTTYELYGFTPLDTPDIELSEVLLAKSGGDTAKQVYRFTKGKTDLSLRFDLTVPLARYVAQHEGSLSFPFRRYHIGKVHRGERAQAGRFREFYQCDIDVIGSESPIVDAEIPAIINEIFEKFDFGEFTIRVNNRKILNGFFESLGLRDKSIETLRLVDKLEKLSREELAREFKSIGLDDQQIEKLFDFVSVDGSNSAVIEQLKSLNVDSDMFTQGVSELETLINSLRRMGVPERRYRLDLKIARGLDYYTGTVYETVLNEHPEVGSVCSGGRFDDLAGLYTKTKLPGVGISIGLTRLFYKLREAGIIKPCRQSPADVMLMPISAEQIDYSLEISRLLREAGIAALLYTEPNSMKAKLRYANRMGYSQVLILGENETSSSTVAVKDMENGQTSSVLMKELVDHLKEGR